MSLHHTTPVIQSPVLSELAGRPVLLKMDCHQPTGSFKIRGVGALCEHAHRAGASRLVCSSGGNAGYAVAYAARRLTMEALVIVPRSTPAFMRALIETEGAKVEVWGEVWDEADLRAREAATDPGSRYVPPFDDPLLWAGHASLVEELAAQIERPGAVAVAVGGGGLLCGVVEGLDRVDWGSVEIIAAETRGAASLAACARAGRHVSLAAIKTIAKSLGARRVADRAYAALSRAGLRSAVVTDRQAVSACLLLARHHRVLVEPACGAALAAALNAEEISAPGRSVLVVVCGGAAVTPALLESWTRDFGLTEEREASQQS